MVALNTNVINFHEKHRGKIVSLLNAFFAGSPSIFAVIYYNVIAKTVEGRDTAESFSDFMLLFAISFGAVDILCMIFLRIYKTDEFDQEITVEQTSGTSNVSQPTEMKDVSAESTETACCNSQKHEGEKSIIEILKDVDYHLFTWTFTAASVVGLVFNVVTTQTTGALGLSNHDEDLVVIVPVVNALVSVTIGIVSDKFKHKFPRLLILLCGCFAFTICEVFMVALGDKYVCFIFAAIFCGFGVGILWSISPTIMSEYFHVNNLGRNWGMALFLGSVVGLAVQLLFGYIYDLHVSEGDIYCYGMVCVRGGHAIVLGFGGLSLITGTILFIKRKRQQRINPQ